MYAEPSPTGLVIGDCNELSHLAWVRQEPFISQLFIAYCPFCGLANRDCAVTDFVYCKSTLVLGSTFIHTDLQAFVNTWASFESRSWFRGSDERRPDALYRSVGNLVVFWSKLGPKNTLRLKYSLLFDESPNLILERK